MEILTGPELIAGSTRMMAGTAQKIALNALSTAVMVALGKTYGALHGGRARHQRQAAPPGAAHGADITGAAEADAAAALAAADGRVKPALVALLAGVDPAEAARRLAASGGRVRACARA